MGQIRMSGMSMLAGRNVSSASGNGLRAHGEYGQLCWDPDRCMSAPGLLGGMLAGGVRGWAVVVASCSCSGGRSCSESWEVRGPSGRWVARPPRGAVWSGATSKRGVPAEVVPRLLLSARRRGRRHKAARSADAAAHRLRISTSVAHLGLCFSSWLSFWNGGGPGRLLRARN